MEFEELFLTREQCQHLLELGLDMSDSVFCWTKGIGTYAGTVDEDWFITQTKRINELKPYYFHLDIIPTYTLNEIIKKLPNWDITQFGKAELHSQLTMEITNGFSYVCKSPIVMINQCHRRVKGRMIDYDYNLLNDAYRMLCWCIENKIMNEKELIIDNKKSEKNNPDKNWIPKIGEKYYAITYSKSNDFRPFEFTWDNAKFEREALKNGSIFRTYEECLDICNRRNDAIKDIK